MQRLTSTHHKVSSSFQIRIVSITMTNLKMWWLFAAVMIHSINLSMGDEPKIIIIGAGPSGIAAATKLYKHGFNNVTILEAENRIGGRVKTVWFDSSWMDLGGQWVHGQNSNLVFDMASPLGLLEVPEEVPHFLVYNSQGDLIPPSISDPLLELYQDLDDRSTDDLVSDNGSAGEYFDRMMTAEAAKFPSVDETMLRQFINISERLENIADGSDSWYDTAARGYVQYRDCAGSQMVNWKDRGYGTILDILMKKYPNPEEELPVMENTILNTEVVNINYNFTKGKALIETSDGTKYTADHVIVTPSLGVLKAQYETLFTPQLSEVKVKTIKGLAFGNVAKIFLSFQEPWWPKNLTGFPFLWNDSDKQEYENDPTQKWLLDMVGCFMVPNRPTKIICWMYGPGGRVMETLPEEQVLDQTIEIMNKFLGKSFSIPRPTGILRSQWHSNKHFRGTYSYRSMETDRADVWPAQLAEPIIVAGKPIVMFAGEGSNPHRFSTVDGAIESGYREANRLVDIYKTKTER